MCSVCMCMIISYLSKLIKVLSKVILCAVCAETTHKDPLHLKRERERESVTDLHLMVHVCKTHTHTNSKHDCL